MGAFNSTSIIRARNPDFKCLYFKSWNFNLRVKIVDFVSALFEKK